MSGLKVNFNK
ncbi:hypothetical protein A2U01_0053971, partial [Trifolium medium]|nr:hypothetical protein [Trifolium medium]